MARRESPLDPSEGPLQSFADDLRALRQDKGLTYRQLAAKAGYSRTTLSDAASGKMWPTVEVVCAYVGACGSDELKWRHRWQEVDAWLSAERARASRSAPAPAVRPDEGPRPLPFSVPGADRHLVELLSAVQQYWVTAELRHSLDLTGHLPIRLIDHANPARSVLETCSIRRIFQYSPHLLVLGEPGIGKTMLLLELTQQLADAWLEDPTQPVPVVMPLSSWAQRRAPLDSWLVEQLFRLYSVDHKLAWQWVFSRRVLPLLDGLDEVPAKHRDACATAINDYRYGRGAVYPLVITCRTEVYRSLSTPLRLRRTLEIQRLSIDDVREHLQTTDSTLSGVRQAIDHDQALADMVTTPLFLALVSYTYRGRSAAVIPVAQDTQGLRRELFHDYVMRRLRDQFPAKPDLTGQLPRHDEQRILHWLSWLARSMRQSNQTVFHPDLMQPAILSGPSSRWLIAPRFPIVIGLTTGVFFGTLTGVAIDALSAAGTQRPGSGITAGIIEGLVVGLTSAAQCLQRNIEPIRPPQRSALALGRSLLRGARWSLLGAVLGAVAGLWFGTMDGTQTLGVFSYLLVGICGWLLSGATGGATLGAIAGLALGTVSNLHTESNVRPTRPGLGMRDTLRTAAAASVITTVIGTSAYGLLFGLSLGAVVALRIGGAAYLRHHLLRLLLVRQNAISPQLLPFLHRAHTLVLLTEIGGGYKFTHPLLQDYFADLETRPSAS